MTRAFKGHEVVPLWGVFRKRIRTRVGAPTIPSSIHLRLFVSVIFLFPPTPTTTTTSPPRVPARPPQLRERRVHRRSFEIRGQIATAELSTCLASGWMPAVHIDPRRGPGAPSWTHLDIAGVMKCFFSFFSVFIKKNQSGVFESLFGPVSLCPPTKHISETEKKNEIYEGTHFTLTLDEWTCLM